MNKRAISRLLAPSTSSINGVSCMPEVWSHFDFERTGASGGTDLFRKSILVTFAKASIPAPWTHREVVQLIAEQAHVPIESLAGELTSVAGARGYVLFEFAGNELDKIADYYPKMRWWVSATGLNMQIAEPQSRSLSPFDEAAARLMIEARDRHGDRLPQAEYARIASALDDQKFELLDHLEGNCRKRLADWNQKHPREAIKRWKTAMASKLPHVLIRGVKRRLYRAEEKFRRIHCPKLSAH